MSNSAWPDGVDRLLLDEVDSTSAEAARIASDIIAPTWVFARHQTAAKGRRGRAWANPEGNFAASLVYRPDDRPERRALRSFVASLALRDALVEVSARPDAFALKWPNDVLLKGRKLAGILLESGPSETLIVGIGVNMAAAPLADQVEPGALTPIALNPTFGTQTKAEALLTPLAAAFAALEAQFATYGFGPIRTRWLEGAARLGQRITARTMTDSVEGTFETIDLDGRLVLGTSHGPRTIAAADVFFD